MSIIQYPVTPHEVGVRIFDDLNNYHHHQKAYGQPMGPIKINWRTYQKAIAKAKAQLSKPVIGSEPVDIAGVEIRLVFSGRELVPHNG